MTATFENLLRRSRGMRNLLEHVEALQAEIDELKECAPDLAEEKQKALDQMLADMPNGYDTQAGKWLRVD